MAAVELAAAEVAGERGQPAAAGQAAGVAHRVLALDAGPVGQRRAGDDDRPEQLRPDRRHHHHRPAGLAVADDARLAFGVRVQRDHLLEEHRLGAHDVLDGLARHRVGREADEVARMAGAHRHAQLAVGLEAADARPVPGARIDHHERPLLRIDRDPGRRLDARQQVVDRLGEGAAVQHQLGVEAEHMRHRLRLLLVVLRRCAGAVTSQNRIVRCIASVTYSPTGPQACRARFASSPPSAGAGRAAAASVFCFAVARRAVAVFAISSLHLRSAPPRGSEFDWRRLSTRSHPRTVV